MTQIDGAFSFKQAWESMRREMIAGVEVGVLDAELLLKNKQASGRDKDLGDIAWLEKHLRSQDDEL